MLVLTRKSGEGVRIGDEVRIVVLEIKGNQVRIGIEAPSDTHVHRDEVYERIKHENIRASATTAEHMQKLFNLWMKKESK